MPIIEGTRALKTWTGSYSFAVQGGAMSTIVLSSPDGPLPIGSIVTGGYLEVTTALDSAGAATGALQCVAANDVVNAAAFDGAPWSSTGRKDIIPDATGSTALKTTAAATSPAFVVGGAALTAGVFNLVLFYK